MPETATREDPYRAYNFIVEIDSIAVAGFSEVSGLSGDTDVVEYREGTDVSMAVRKLPGRPKWGQNLTLKVGMTTSRVLWQWRLAIINGSVDRRNGAVVLLDEQRNRVAEWQFENAWVVKYEGPALNAKGNDVAVETLELAHEGLRLV
jgi:phage tail-like protein